MALFSARSICVCAALFASATGARGADPAESIPPAGALPSPSVSDPYRTKIHRSRPPARPAREVVHRTYSPPSYLTPLTPQPYAPPAPLYVPQPYVPPVVGIPPYAPPPGGHVPIYYHPSPTPPPTVYVVPPVPSPPRPPRGMTDPTPDPRWRPYGPGPFGPGPGGQPPATWEGFYFGGSFSRSWAKINRTWNVTDHWVQAGTSFGQESTGFLGAGMLGYNLQVDRMTLGIEASMLASKFTQSVLAPADSTVGSDPITADYKLKSLYMVAGRAGISVADFLPYFKGGWAFGEIETYTRDSMPSGALLHDATTSKMQNGPVVGFGVDYMATPNVIVGLSYDYVRLLDANHYVARVNDNGQALASPVFASSDVNATFHMLSARLLMRIDPR